MTTSPDRPTAGGKWRPSDRLAIYKSDNSRSWPSTNTIELDAATLEEAAAKVEYMAQVPGAWWLRQSPADVLEPIGTRQSVVWELMFPRGYRKTESTGYQVQWHRNTEDDDKS